MKRFVAVTLLALTATTCGGESEPVATFTGDDCNYQGPTGFDVGSETSFTFINNSDVADPGFAIAKVPEGTTADQIDCGVGAVGADADSLLDGGAPGQTPSCKTLDLII